MKIENLSIEGLRVISAQIFHDQRGYFVEKYNRKVFDKLELPTGWIQDNFSYSKQGVIRGIHLQKKPNMQAKLVSCHRGKIRDIAVDLRKNSPTFGKHLSVELSESNGFILYIPFGFGHGFEVISEDAYVSYKVIGEYSKEDEISLSPFDKELDIKWRTRKDEAIFSKKDEEAMSFSTFCSLNLDI